MADLPANYVPRHALHPGRELAEELDARGISADDLASGIRRRPSVRSSPRSNR